MNSGFLSSSPTCCFLHGSSSFTSSAGNSQDSAGCTNHASPSGNGVRILPPSSMTHGTSASPLHGPSDPVDMTGNEIGEDKNSERLIYQDALQNLNQPRTEVDLPPGTLSVPLMRHQKIALAWMLRKETTCLDCSGGILAADQGLGKTVSMIALILKQKYESQLKSEITSKQESEILDLDADDDESENAKHDESGSHARPPELKVSSDSETIVLLSDDENGSSDMENAKDEEARELNSNKRPAAGTLVVCPASVVTQWVRELDEKVSDESKLSVLVYHGGNRTKDPSVLAKYDVVITTYAIVTNEVPKQFLLDEDEDENDDSHSFSNSKKRKVSVSASKNRGSFGGTLSRVGWLRVVLDEAQTIKNHRTQVARACRILRAKRRWCLSGAPIQNTVDDLYSYFRAHEGEEPPSQEPIKTLVFSQWNGMLDLVELCFVENGIEFRRLDGTMSLAARDRAVKEFSNDSDVEVMLMSLKAGNLGLNMVAASHEEKRRMVASAYGEDHGGSSATRLLMISTFSIDAPDWWTHGEGANPMMFTKKLMFLCGEVILWSSLKNAPSQMVYMCGNIEEGLLMKMLTKTGIQILGVDYGNLKPPPKKVEAQISDGTETQPKKDTAPPPEIVVSTSTKHKAKNKKPSGFKKKLLSMSQVVMRT
ncbi:hypothetical protein IGI04_003271 [Brassica rapa subsp. trilocularis]|uniref:Helicase ATP-binding domain-containing protein n=1 Tax=Brassica rapa subsp. trilocularis TaxID=1813537 RepID=A0ABQ7NXZ2_BRACM|nr:hypothetical protein IGI04_003271 [Brassica rapa subsp. trilocularis]